jgi:hypothetical protein
MATQPGSTENPVAGTDPFEGGAQDAHIADVFGFDPEEIDSSTQSGDATDFAEPAAGSDPEAGDPAGAAPGSSVGAGEGEGEALEGASPKPEPAPATPPAPAPDDTKLELESLRAQLKALQEKQDAKPAAETPAPETQPAAPKAPEPVNVKLPYADRRHSQACGRRRGFPLFGSGSFQPRSRRPRDHSSPDADGILRIFPCPQGRGISAYSRCRCFRDGSAVPRSSVEC